MNVTISGNIVDLSVRRTERFYVELKLSAYSALGSMPSALKMQVRDATFGPVILELSTANGRIAILDAALWVIALDVSGDDMRQLSRGDYVHDLATDDDDNTVLLSGAFQVTGGVTRPTE